MTLDDRPESPEFRESPLPLSIDPTPFFSGFSLLPNNRPNTPFFFLDDTLSLEDSSSVVTSGFCSLRSLLDDAFDGDDDAALLSDAEETGDRSLMVEVVDDPEETCFSFLLFR